MTWEKVKLGNIFQIKHGWAFKGEFFSNAGELIIVTPGNFYEKGGFKRIAGKEKYYLGEYPEEFLLKKNDVIIAMTEQGPGLLGSPAIVPDDNTYLHNQRIGLITETRSSLVDKSFIYRLFFTDTVRNEIAASATGTKVKHTAPIRIYDIEISLPPLPTQRRIASILSAYDDLIENNLKRIKLLEEKALMEYRILFKENELKEFPIEDVWEIKYGKNLPQTKITEFGKYPVYGAAGRIGFYEEFNYEFPIALVTSRGNGSGVAHRTNQAAFVTNNSFAFVEKEKFVNVHFHLAEMILRDLELTQLRSGTAQPQLTIAGLIGVKLKLPNKEALIEYNKIVDPSFDLLHTLEKQNTKLREARDILLPKLMNGQIEV